MFSMGKHRRSPASAGASSPHLSYPCRALVLPLLALFLLSAPRWASAQTVYATCNVVSGSGSGNVSGTIELSQTPGANLFLTINLYGFNASGVVEHGFHVHANGSLSNKCESAGPHFNLDNTLHGAPWNPRLKRHTGDLGNINMTNGNVLNVTISDWLMNLTGNADTSIIGKPIVIHAGQDDLGLGNSSLSNTTGNAGARLGCCIIELTSNASTSAISTPPSSASTQPTSVSTQKSFAPAALFPSVSTQKSSAPAALFPTLPSLLLLTLGACHSGLLLLRVRDQ